MSNQDSKKDGMVQARHENSVLFTLNDLQTTNKTDQKKGKPIPRPEQEDASGFIDLASFSSAANMAKNGQTTGAPNPNGNTEASGYINLNDLASMESGQSTEAPPAPAMPPVDHRLVPMGQKESNKGVTAAIVASAVLLLVVGGILAYVMTSQPKDTGMPAVPPPPTPIPPAPKAPAAPAPDKKAAPLAKTKAQKPGSSAKAQQPDAAATQGKKPTKTSPPKAAKGQNSAESTKKPAAKAPVETTKTEPLAPPPKEAPPAEKKPNVDGLDKVLGTIDKSKTLPTSLSRGDVKKAISRHRGKINQCGGENRNGTVVVSFVVNPTGKVGNAQVTGAKKGSSEGACVQRVVRGMAFPAFSGKSQTINYPFVLP